MTCLPLAAKSPSSAMLKFIDNLHHKLLNNHIQTQIIWKPGDSGIAGNEKRINLRKTLPLNSISICQSNMHPLKHLFYTQFIRNGRAIRRTFLAKQLRRIKLWLNCSNLDIRKKRNEEKVLARLQLAHAIYNHGFTYSRVILANIESQSTFTSYSCPLWRHQRSGMTDLCVQENSTLKLVSLVGSSNQCYEATYTFCASWNQVFDIVIIRHNMTH